MGRDARSQLTDGDTAEREALTVKWLTCCRKNTIIVYCLKLMTRKLISYFSRSEASPI